MHKSTRTIDDDNQCTRRQQQSARTISFNNKPCKDGIQDLIITTHKDTQQTFKWNLGESIVEIKLLKKIHFKRVVNLVQCLSLLVSNHDLLLLKLEC
jgi:hypothetical protein